MPRAAGIGAASAPAWGRAFARLDRRRLGVGIVLFFLALAVPTAILIRHAYGQLELAAFHQQRVLADEVARRIDLRLTELIAREEARSFTEYAFLVVAGDPAQNFVQRSPLSAFPVEPTIPGLVGYFQIDPEGAFSTPFVPANVAADYGVSATELAQRIALQERIRSILGSNRLVRTAEATAATEGGAKKDEAPADSERALVARGGAAPSSGDEMRRRAEAASAAMNAAAAPSAPAAQAPFDELQALEADALVEAKAPKSLGRVEDLKLDPTYQRRAEERLDAGPVAAAPPLVDKRAMRKERATIAEPATIAQDDALRLETFESDVDAFELGLLDSGHFVLFRRVWREGRRYIQGLLIEQQALLDDAAAATFRASAIARTSDLVTGYRGNVLALYGGGPASGYASSVDELRGALLHEMHLSPPFNALSLTFSVQELPRGPGARLLDWLAGILALVLCGGCWLMYRLGAGQIELVRQQQDFVSAVSHELKTPLTSIRMYGEMLREGWGSEEQKRSYYEYICDESGRLSRLIHNVLQLARMTRNELPIELKAVTGGELADAIRSKVATQVERAGFTLDLTCEPDAEQARVEVDPDAVLQIVINLVDNALKFSAGAELKRIDIALRRPHDSALLLSVRDYGPGVPKDQARKIFELFYRPANELTRETVGTGIGLALVRQLADAMGARVDVVNREPGAELRVTFP
jgi:signal transduction histidine kinase